MSGVLLRGVKMIEVKNIVKSYNSENVLKGVDLTFYDQEFVSIMGASGSGKSTLLNIIGGFLSPDQGVVLWDGKDVSSLSEEQISERRHTQLGFVFQSFKLISTLTALDNILLPLSLSENINEKSLNYVNELIEELSLTEIINKYPDQLSGGQCQRVAIVRALAYKPSTIILDEPTGALDSVMEEKVMSLLKRVNEQLKTTIIQVTHSDKVASYANRIIRLKDGQVV